MFCIAAVALHYLLYGHIYKRWAPKKKWKHIHSLDFHSKITMTLQLKKSDLKFETVLQEANRFRGKGKPSGTPDHTKRYRGYTGSRGVVLPHALGAAPSLGASQRATDIPVTQRHHHSRIVAGTRSGSTSSRAIPTVRPCFSRGTKHTASSQPTRKDREHKSQKHLSRILKIIFKN